MNENRNISMIEGYNKGSIKIKVSEMNKLVQINGNIVYLDKENLICQFDNASWKLYGRKLLKKSCSKVKVKRFLICIESFSKWWFYDFKFSLDIKNFGILFDWIK